MKLEIELCFLCCIRSGRTTTTMSVTTTDTKSHSRRSHTVSFASAPLIKTFDVPIPKPLVEDNINGNQISLGVCVVCFVGSFIPSLSLSLLLTFSLLQVNLPSTPTVEVTPPQVQPESVLSSVSSPPQTEGSQQSVPSDSNTPTIPSVSDVQSLYLRLDHIEKRLSKIEDTLTQIFALLSSSSSQQISSEEPK
jgi:hypothetical protein